MLKYTVPQRAFWIKAGMAFLLFSLTVSWAGLAAATPVTVPFSRTVQLTGTTDDGFRFAGQFEIVDFFFDGTDILISGDISGSVDQVGPVADQLVSIPVSVIPDPRFCDLLTLAIGPADLDLLGIVHIDPIDLTIDATNAPPEVDSGQLADLLCSINTLLPNELNGVAAILNEVVFIFP